MGKRGVRLSLEHHAEVIRRTMLGQSITTIAKEMSISKGSVNNFRREYKDSVWSHVSPAAKARDKLKPEVQLLLEYSPDAFEEFFNRYSPWKLAPHSKEFVIQAFTSRQVLLNVPPRHGKSRVFSIWLPIWLICRDRDVRIMVLSKTRDLALEFTREIANNLESNHYLVDDFGRFKPEVGLDLDHSFWRPKTGQIEVAGRQKLIMAGSPTLEAYGSGQHIIGRGVDWIISDDVVDLNNSWTEDQRNKLSQWFKQEVLSRREPGAHVLSIGTRAHENDLYGELARQTMSRDDPTPRWKHINFPAIRDREGRAVNDFSKGIALWPERWPLNQDEARKLPWSEWDEEYTSLEEIYRDLGEALWDQTYQQVAIPPSERVVRPEWLYGGTLNGVTYKGCVDSDRAMGPQKLKEGWVRCISIDPSGTKFWAMIVADVFASRDQFQCELLEIHRGKMGVEDARRLVEDLADTYRPGYVVMEQNAFARWFVEDAWSDILRRKFSVRILPHTTGRNKSDDEMGVRAMAPYFEFGQIRIPGLGASTQQNFGIFVDETLAYPYGRTWDTVMCLWFLFNNHRRLVPPARDTGPIPMGWHVPQRLRAPAVARRAG